MNQPLVLAITVGTEEAEDDDMGGGYRTDGVVYINGIEVFRKKDLGWMDGYAEICSHTADLFASRLADVLA